MRLIAAVILAASLGIAGAARAQTDAQTPPGWIADTKTGCKIWNPAPQPHEAVHWSGRCKGGYAEGKGTLQWTENGRPGDRYDGEYQAGKRNGHGVVTEGNGTRVEGDWQNDELLQMGVNEI
ncbi:MAG TPA: hypothetical protein VGP48_02565 [Stellaceae bacterium]|jgi:hypothetical protein|nr:hypothetical protein [Stellaceae bacterium]